MIRIADDAEFFEDDEQVPSIHRPNIDERIVVEHDEVVFRFAYDGPEFDERPDVDDAESFLYMDEDGDPAAAFEIEHARCYDPARGIWLSTEPIGHCDANYDVYPGNVPASPHDPEGL